MRFVALLLTSAMLAACATSGGAPKEAASNAPAIDAKARAEVDRQDVLTRMTFWAKEVSLFPEDIVAARKFATALREGGRHDRAAEFAEEALSKHRGDQELLHIMGVSLVAAGKPQEALRPLALVAQADARNWRARSALGAALDQLGRYEQARLAYQEALAIKPDAADVLTNLGVSYLIAAEPENAVRVLRQAAALPEAPVEARFNLSVALALSGNLDEAERLQRIDLPPEMVASNMAYFREVSEDPRRWNELRPETAKENAPREQPAPGLRTSRP
jgi:Flp pilus assembly protein TadD